MLNAIQRKVSWNDVDEVAMVANIYLTIYQIRYYMFEILDCALN